MATTYDEDGGLSVTRYCGPYNGGDRTRYQIGLVIRSGVVSVNQHDAEVLVRILQRATANQSEDEPPCIGAAAQQPDTKTPDYFIVCTDNRSAWALFWGPNKSGYTCEIENAGRYSRGDAERICRYRGTEIMVPCDIAEAQTVRLCNREELIQAAQQEDSKHSSPAPETNTTKA